MTRASEASEGTWPFGARLLWWRRLSLVFDLTRALASLMRPFVDQLLGSVLYLAAGFLGGSARRVRSVFCVLLNATVVGLGEGQVRAE